MPGMYNSNKKYPPIHKHYDFSYRNIFPYIRNYETIPCATLITRIDTIHELGLQNDFLTAYMEYNNKASVMQEFWNTWDNQRKKAIHTLIYNGANHNLYIVKKSYLTVEYFKLLAWAYSPLPPHILIKED